MIVRILGEGQLDVPPGAVEQLNRLDGLLVDALERADDGDFTHVLAALIDHLHQAGVPLPADHLGPSEFILPGPQATRAEVEALLRPDGLIPG